MSSFGSFRIVRRPRARIDSVYPVSSDSRGTDASDEREGRTRGTDARDEREGGREGGRESGREDVVAAQRLGMRKGHYIAKSLWSEASLPPGKICEIQGPNAATTIHAIILTKKPTKRGCLGLRHKRGIVKHVPSGVSRVILSGWVGL